MVDLINDQQLPRKTILECVKDNEAMRVERWIIDLEFEIEELKTRRGTGVLIEKKLIELNAYRRVMRMEEPDDTIFLDDKAKQIHIAKVIMRHYGMTVSEMCESSARLCNGLALPRHEYFYFCRRHTKLSLRNVGILFYKDHSSVIHGMGLISNQMDVDKVYRERMRGLDNHFKELFKTK